MPTRHHALRMSRYRRPLGPALIVAALLLASCGGGGGGDGERGLAEAKGVSRTFCLALDELIGSYDEAARTESSFAAANRDIGALLEVLPDDAPDGVTAYFEALSEMTALSDIWDNPETGGIKEEYVDDFTRLTGAITGDAAVATVRFAGSRCPDRAGGSSDGPLARFFGSGTASSGAATRPAPSGDVRPTVTTRREPAEVVKVLDDGPAGVYEFVTVDVATVTATDAEPASTFSADPLATTSNSLLVELDLTAAQSTPNQFSADDFRLVDPAGATVAAQSVIDRTGDSAPLALRGRDSARGTVVFPTASLVKDLRGYALRIERDDRVPTVLALSGPVAKPYPMALASGAKGAFGAPLPRSCVDRYETSVTSAGADLDADVGSPSGVKVKRAARGQRWVRVVLQVSNATVLGQSNDDRVCSSFSGNYAAVELRLAADGRLGAPVNPPSFEQITPGTTGERVHVFAVDAKAKALVLTGPMGEALARWTVELPAAPGEG